MKQYIDILKRTKPFSGVSELELCQMLNCLQAQISTFRKGEYVFKQGEHINKITVLVNGELLIQSNSYMHLMHHDFQESESFFSS